MLLYSKLAHLTSTYISLFLQPMYLLIGYLYMKLCPKW